MNLPQTANVASQELARPGSVGNDNRSGCPVAVGDGGCRKRLYRPGADGQFIAHIQASLPGDGSAKERHQRPARQPHLADVRACYLAAEGVWRYGKPQPIRRPAENADVHPCRDLLTPGVDIPGYRPVHLVPRRARRQHNGVSPGNVDSFGGHKRKLNVGAPPSRGVRGMRRPPGRDAPCAWRVELRDSANARRGSQRNSRLVGPGLTELHIGDNRIHAGHVGH